MTDAKKTDEKKLKLLDLAIERVKELEAIPAALANLGLFVLDFIEEHEWGFEESEDISEEALRLGLMERVEYDPAKHGEDIDAEPGMEIWLLRPAVVDVLRHWSSGRTCRGGCTDDWRDGVEPGSAAAHPPAPEGK